MIATSFITESDIIRTALDRTVPNRTGPNRRTLSGTAHTSLVGVISSFSIPGPLPTYTQQKASSEPKRSHGNSGVPRYSVVFCYNSGLLLPIASFAMRSLSRKALAWTLLLGAQCCPCAEAFTSGRRLSLVAPLGSPDVIASTTLLRSRLTTTTRQYTTTTSAAVRDVPSSPSSSTISASLSPQDVKRLERQALIRKEGGKFAFDTKFGALNPYAIYYGLTSILLGLPWFAALTMCQFFYFVTRNRIDKQRRMAGFVTQMWGVALMALTRARPPVENAHILQDFYKQHRPAMFVANHNSWMDIPFLGGTIGWRNYKLVSKKELGKVPILGKAIKVGGHIMVDRANRKSQLITLKRGIQYLKVR